MRTRLYYDATIYVTGHPDYPRTSVLSATDADRALRQAKHEVRGADAIEIRRSGSTLVLRSWGSRMPRRAGGAA